MRGQNTRYGVYLCTCRGGPDRLVDSRVNKRAAERRARELQQRVRAGADRLYYVCRLPSRPAPPGGD